VKSGLRGALEGFFVGPSIAKPEAMKNNLETDEKKLYGESLIKRIEIGKNSKIELTLYVPLGEFRVFIPDISATGRETQNGVYNLS
jgi:hypothetical protein